jgi:DNA-binding NarL/FixJ family response regulator
MTQSSLPNPSVAESRRASNEPVRVLLVDDNEAMLARAAAVLEPAGYVVVGAVTDGLSALDAAARSRPHVIVLDISMRGMSGFDVAIHLRKADPHAAIVFLTVHDEEEFVRAARAVGGLGYVLKSRLISDLTHAIREARRGRPFVSPLIAPTRAISPS